MVDVIIIGAGAAGMTSALYALRNGHSVLLIESEALGGQIATSPRVENFPSIKEISGAEFADNLFEQISALGAQVELDKALTIEKNGGYFTVKGEYGEYEGKSIIIAAGVKHKHLRASGEQDLLGKGVYYCAICDGAFYKGKEVALIGDANSALQYAMLLSGYCPKVHMFTLFDKFFGDDRLVKAVRKRENVIVYPDTAVTAFIGKDQLEAIEYKDKNGELHRFDTPAVFVAIGQIPDNKAFENLVDLDKDGYIVADENCATRTQGVFTAGDCRTKKIRQLTTSVSDGAIAAMGVCDYLDGLES